MHPLPMVPLDGWSIVGNRDLVLIFSTDTSRACCAISRSGQGVISRRRLCLCEFCMSICLLLGTIRRDCYAFKSRFPTLQGSNVRLHLLCKHPSITKVLCNANPESASKCRRLGEHASHNDLEIVASILQSGRCHCYKMGSVSHFEWWNIKEFHDWALKDNSLSSTDPHVNSSLGLWTLKFDVNNKKKDDAVYYLNLLVFKLIC